MLTDLYYEYVNLFVRPSSFWQIRSYLMDTAVIYVCTSSIWVFWLSSTFFLLEFKHSHIHRCCCCCCGIVVMKLVRDEVPNGHDCYAMHLIINETKSRWKKTGDFFCSGMRFLVWCPVLAVDIDVAEGDGEWLILIWDRLAWGSDGRASSSFAAFGRESQETINLDFVW